MVEQLEEDYTVSMHPSLKPTRTPRNSSHGGQAASKPRKLARKRDKRRELVIAAMESGLTVGQVLAARFAVIAHLKRPHPEFSISSPEPSRRSNDSGWGRPSDMISSRWS